MESRLRDFGLTLWLLFVIVVLAAAGCSTPADIESRELVNAFGSATRQGIECRSTISNKPEYRTIAAHIPVLDVNQATLSQMLDASLVNLEDNVVLVYWQRDIRACGNQLVDVIQRTAPAYVPIVLAMWNKDDEVLVLLARRKIGWGDAVMRLKANRTELLTRVADQMSRMMVQLNQRKQAELDRRASAIESLLGLVP